MVCISFSSSSACASFVDAKDAEKAIDQAVGWDPGFHSEFVCPNACPDVYSPSCSPCVIENWLSGV
jgi:hypothetical protein